MTANSGAEYMVSVISGESELLMKCLKQIIV